MQAFVDLRWLIPGYSGGIERMARSFLVNASQSGEKLGMDVLLPTAARRTLKLQRTSGISLHNSDGMLYYVDRLARRGLHVLAQNPALIDTSSLAQFLKKRADVGLSLSGYIYRDLMDLNHVLVISDIQHEYYPEFFTQAELARRRSAFNNSLEVAKKICAVSVFTKNSLVARLGIREEKIRVVHEAADPIFSAPSSDEHVSGVMEKYGLPKGEYLYYPANTWHHKNHLKLLEAVALLADQKGLRPIIIFSGAKKEAHDEIVSAVHRKGLERQVRFIGLCPFEDLPALYKGAAAMVYPSLFEGFGLPVLEAMASGCPVVCSNAASLPEIGGAAALYFDPTSAEDMATRMEIILTKSENRQVLISEGRKRSAMFSWEKFSTSILDEMAGVTK